MVLVVVVVGPPTWMWVGDCGHRVVHWSLPVVLSWGINIVGIVVLIWCTVWRDAIVIAFMMVWFSAFVCSVGCYGVLLGGVDG